MDGSTGSRISRTTDVVATEQGRRVRRPWYRTRPARIGLMAVLPLVLVLTGMWFYLASERYVSTDDAYVEADKVSISSDVSGRVVAVLVHDNEMVHAGQVLLRIDDRPYRIAVARAEAQLQSARLNVEGLRARYRQSQDELTAAEDTLGYATREFARFERLHAARLASEAQLDAARHALNTARQNVAAAQQGIANALASLGGNADIPTDQNPQVALAAAELAQARLDLSHTVVAAPSDGVVTKVSALPVGNYLTTGTPAFVLVETGHMWVEANFKETELAHVVPGESARISVDTYSGTHFAGLVESLTPATGAQFSVLPPQNATGNWVKVVQRLPVRVAITDHDPATPLRAGMSVAVTIDTHYRNPIIAGIDSFLGV